MSAWLDTNNCGEAFHEFTLAENSLLLIHADGKPCESSEYEMPLRHDKVERYQPARTLVQDLAESILMVRNAKRTSA